MSVTTLPKLSKAQFDSLGRELDELRQRVIDDLGEADRKYIYDVIKVQRTLEVMGRGLLFAGFFPPAWVLGVTALSVSKILDNMEIGHNVMHGQYDWMRDPALNSKMFDWDTVAPAENWKHSHNYIHHTYTNILGKDRDIGYGVLRMDEGQKWNPYYLGNPVYACLLMVLFEWGVMLHDMETEKLLSGEKKWSETKGVRQRIWQKGLKQTLKDYVLFPALTGPMFLTTLAGNATANLVRNVWAFSIIFCGHFPSGVQTFTEAETENESRGQWYYRQMLGSANISGGPLFHLMSGNLSHQIEHHLFPDIPARRYPQIAPEVRAICEKYGLPYNTGGFSRQLTSVFTKIVRLALPDSLWGSPSGPPAGTVGSGRAVRAA
ncbi:linoleoyl-CoA desaturase [Actinokineospora alba]|uniref:Linoleoyl-CoA desaturase n=1 Tax=Actinokineospora alba TaxID=504798 RepID=A0A1H0JY11_9PSEU|nr:acyl-CoA desaturase [Actinokineospora alba]TDP68118.1 linoleoyl-CoA desaturase [Actinokineospora alba]SDH92680.1 linoleoyl-CoA desaturase [Actinokineospora alba]SDO48566.1 linoleoyl-CoA desaturase [Actinokineospora alba]